MTSLQVPLVVQVVQVVPLVHGVLTDQEVHVSLGVQLDPGFREGP